MQGGQVLQAVVDSVGDLRELEDEKRHLEELIAEVSDPLEAELRDKGLALLIGQAGGVARPVIMPLVEGQPVPPERESMR